MTDLGVITNDFLFAKRDITDRLPASPRICNMKITITTLNKRGISQLAIEIPVHLTTETKSTVDIANPRPAKTVVIAYRN